MKLNNDRLATLEKGDVYYRSREGYVDVRKGALIYHSTGIVRHLSDSFEVGAPSLAANSLDSGIRWKTYNNGNR